eukprot:12888888-Prorocentrum_lima.AAC.1
MPNVHIAYCHDDEDVLGFPAINQFFKPRSDAPHAPTTTSMSQWENAPHCSPSTSRLVESYRVPEV